MITTKAPTRAPKPRACAGRKRPGTALKLWIPDATHAHMEAIKTLTTAILGTEVSHSISARLALRHFAGYLHEVHAATQRPNGRMLAGAEVLKLKMALADARGAQPQRDAAR